MKPQIATTPTQSARLIACGVDLTSADMCYLYWDESGEQLSREEYLEIFNESFLDGRIELVPKDFGDYDHSYENDSPAWSLSALLALFPDIEGRYFSLTKEYPLPGGYSVAYLPWHTDGKIRYAFQDNPIEACVRKIEYLTSKGIKLNYDN